MIEQLFNKLNASNGSKLQANAQKFCANDDSAAIPINPWTPWEHLSNNVPSMIDAMSTVLRDRPLSDFARQTICSAAQEFDSPDAKEKARTRAKIAYFLVMSFQG